MTTTYSVPLFILQGRKQKEVFFSLTSKLKIQYLYGSKLDY